MAEWLRRLTLKLLAPLHWGSNPMRGSWQVLTEGCCFTPRNNVFLQLWKLTAIYNLKRLKNGVKHQFTSTQYQNWAKLIHKVINTNSRSIWQTDNFIYQSKCIVCMIFKDNIFIIMCVVSLCQIVSVHPMRLRLAYSVGFKLLGLRCSVDDMVYHDTIWYGVILFNRSCC